LFGAAEVLNNTTPEEPKKVKCDKSDQYYSYYVHALIITETARRGEIKT